MKCRTSSIRWSAARWDCLLHVGKPFLRNIVMHMCTFFGDSTFACKLLDEIMGYGDKLHDSIHWLMRHEMLDEMIQKLRLARYVPDSRILPHRYCWVVGMVIWKKRSEHCCHSETLPVCNGSISTKARTHYISRIWGYVNIVILQWR